MTITLFSILHYDLYDRYKYHGENTIEVIQKIQSATQENKIFNAVIERLYELSVELNAQDVIISKLKDGNYFHVVWVNEYNKLAK